MPYPGDPENWGRYAPHIEKLDLVIEEILRLGRTYPEHAYQSPNPGSDIACWYNRPSMGDENHPGDRSGCIIGSALRNVGHPASSRMEGKNGDKAVASTLKLPRLIHQLMDERPAFGHAHLEGRSPQVVAIYRRLWWILEVQTEQDGGNTWGEATGVTAQVDGVDWAPYLERTPEPVS